VTVTEGLFAPELSLGYTELDPLLRARLQAYLRDVIAARGFPLHVSVAWNALHFGFDPAEGSYDDMLLEAEMPTVELAGQAPAIPVGALAYLHVGGQQGELWAEVVGKDGRPSGVDPDGTAPAELAGRPADHQDIPIPGGDERRSMAVVSEALICDFQPFGPQPRLDVILDRLERRDRLGGHRLVEMDSVYEPAEAAEDSDVWFYARWLFDKQQHLLRAGPLGAGLESPSDEDLRAALVASLRTVDVLLSSVPGVVRWGDYALLEEWVDDIDLTPDLPLHRADIEHLIVSMASGRGRGPTCTALGPRLEEIARPAVNPARPDAVVIDPLEGVGYLRVVASTSRWLADRIDESGGVVEARGARRLFRVDDNWAWCGLWRSEPYGSGHPLAGVPADEPLGIGWRGWSSLAQYLERPLEELTAEVERALSGPAEPEAAEPEPIEAEASEPERAGEETIEPEEPAEMADEEEAEEELPEEDLISTLVEAQVTLRQVDIDRGELPLPDRFAWLGDGAEVTVALRHDGFIDADQRSQTAKAACDDGIPRLEGLSWPMDFLPGFRLHVTAFTGGRVLFAATVSLGQPVLVDGVEYRFTFDPAVVGKACPSEPTLAAVCVSVLARHGRPASDGTRRASAREICTFCFGPGRPPALAAAVASALDPLVESGRLAMIGSEYAWSPGMRPKPRRSTPTGWEMVPVRREMVRQHYVPGFLRRLHPGWQASEEAEQRYEEDRRAGLIFGAERLPAGYTYVTGHERGHRRSAYAYALRGIVSSIDGRSPSDDEMEVMFEEWEGQ
jgi:hypothetical protein